MYALPWMMWGSQMNHAVKVSHSAIHEKVHNAAIAARSAGVNLPIPKAAQAN